MGKINEIDEVEVLKDKEHLLGITADGVLVKTKKESVLGIGSYLGSQYDLNNFKTTGVHVTEATKNSPLPEGGMLRVDVSKNGIGTFVLQEIFGRNTAVGKHAYRTYRSDKDEWTPWVLNKMTPI